MVVSAEVDERSLREIYLRAFEIAVTEAKPTSVMCAYNKVNGAYCTENEWLLKDILINEFGFDGLCISDWGAVNDRIPGIKAGLDLQMPGDGGTNASKIVDAVNSGQLKESELDTAVKNNLNLIFKLSSNNNSGQTFDKESHHRLARQLASEGMVLLKNNNHILPIDKSQKQEIGVVGLFAKSPRYQGAGSSLVNPTRLDNFLEVLDNTTNKQFSIHYADGYNKLGETNDSLINEVIKVAEQSAITIVFAGLPDNYESEGFDRQTLDLPDGHNKIIEKITEVSNKVIVVLQNGSPVTMPWLEQVDGVLEAYLGGQAGGAAIADVLFGNVNPSGKLAETFPQELRDTPSFLTWPGENNKSFYNEGIFVGYRYYDMKGIKPLFPFGYGLSYTKFEYSDLEIDKSDITDTDYLSVSCKIKNTGKYDGKEIVQLYIHDIQSDVIRPLKELKGFDKIALKQGEEKVVRFNLSPRDFQYYSTKYKTWKSDSGEYEILIGSSSRDIILSKKVNLTASQKYYQHYDLYSTLEELKEHPIGAEFVNQIIGRSMARYNVDDLNDLEKDARIKQIRMIERSMLEMPLKKMLALSAGSIPESKILDLIDKINRDIESKNKPN
jgi:beta-glucosidase